MSLYKRNKTWWTDFSINGQRYRQSLDTSDWREGQHKEKELIAQASQGKLTPSGQSFARLGFSEAAARFLEQRKVEVSEGTWQTEKDKMKPLQGFFSRMRINQVSADAIRTYQAHRHTAGRHPRTINHEVKLLQRLLRRAKVPLPDVGMLPVPQSAISVLTQDEKDRLFRTASSKPGWMVACCAALLTAHASLRPCELRGLHWRDVDPQERTFLIRRSKSGAGVRVVPLNEEAWSAICTLRMRAHALDTNAPEHFVFHRLWPKVDANRPMSDWRSAWRSLRKAAGMPQLRYYDLRHLCVTEMLEAGVPEGVIREVVGHVDPAMTRWYSHPRLAAKRAAVEVLSRSKEDSEGTGYVTNHVTKALPEKTREAKSLKEWYAWRDSNTRPLVPETSALSTELQAHGLLSSCWSLYYAFPLRFNTSELGKFGKINSSSLPTALRCDPGTTCV